MSVRSRAGWRLTSMIDLTGDSVAATGAAPPTATGQTATGQTAGGGHHVTTSPPRQVVAQALPPRQVVVQALPARQVVAQALPLRVKVDGLAASPVWVAWKPTLIEPLAGIVPL
jgi:hypothetical protein